MKIQIIHHKKIDELIKLTQEKTLENAVLKGLEEIQQLIENKDDIFMKFYKTVDKTIQFPSQTHKLKLATETSEELLNYFQEKKYPLSKVLIAYVNYLKYQQMQPKFNKKDKVEKKEHKKSNTSKYHKQDDDELVLDPQAIQARLKSHVNKEKKEHDHTEQVSDTKPETAHHKQKTKNTAKKVESDKKSVTNQNNKTTTNTNKSATSSKNLSIDRTKSRIKTPTEIRSLKDELQEHKENINNNQVKSKNKKQTNSKYNTGFKQVNKKMNKQKNEGDLIDTDISFIESDDFTDIMSKLDEKYGIMLINSKNIGSHTIYELYDTDDKENIVVRYDNYTHKTVVLTTDTPIDSAVCTNYINELKKRINEQKIKIRKNNNNHNHKRNRKIL